MVWGSLIFIHKHESQVQVPQICNYLPTAVATVFSVDRLRIVADFVTGLMWKLNCLTNSQSLRGTRGRLEELVTCLSRTLTVSVSH